MRRTLLLVGLLSSAGCAADSGGASDAFAILTPAGDETLHGLVDVVVALPAGVDPESLEMFVDETPIAAAWRTEGDAVVTAFDTRGIPDGLHALEVGADIAGRTRLARIVTIDNAGPELAIEEPIDRVFHEDGPFSVVVRVAEGADVEALRIRVDGRMVAEISPVVRDRNVASADPFDYLPDGSNVGRVVIEAEAVESTGRTSTTTRTIDIASRRVFSFPTLGRVWEAPELLWDGAVAVATAEGVLHVVEPDGTERCHVRADGERGGTSPTYVPGADAIVWGTTHHLRISSAATCAQLYVDETAREFVAKPVVTGAGVIHAVTFDGTKIAFAADGSGRAVVELASLVTGGSAIEARSALDVGSDGTVYLAARVGYTGGALFAQRPDGTVEVAELTTPVESDLLVTDAGIFFGGADGGVYAYGLDLGRRWVAAASDVAPIRTRPAFDGVNVVVGDGEGRVHGRDPITGDVLWEYDALLDRAPTGLGLVGRAGIATSPAGDVVFGDALGMLHVLHADGILRFRARVGTGSAGDGIVARPAVRSDRLYVGTEGQTLVAFALR